MLRMWRNWYVRVFSISHYDGIIIGLMVGLSATGLYSGSKNVFETSSKQLGKK